jgi:hypothetical protein
MSTSIEMAQQLNNAFMEKDEATLCKLLSPAYTARCPLSSVSSRDEALEMMKTCSFVCHNENSVFLADGTAVAHFFDWVVEAPFQSRIRTAQYITIDGEQISSVELFYDTSALPKEMLEQLEEKRLTKV